jgi:hypothetical protein
MRRFMMLVGLALVASLALAGVTAVSASAVSPEILLTNPAGVTYPQNVVSTDNNPSTLKQGIILTVTCSSLLLKGKLLSEKKALLLLLWHKCSDGINPCQSAGEPSGLIHTLLLALPVWLNSAKTLPGLLFERHQGNADLATFSCGSNTILVRGSVLGHIPKPAKEVKSHTMEVEVLTKGTSQEFEKVEEGAEVDKLEASLNGGGFSSATEEVKKDVVEFETAGVEAEFR